MSTRDCSRCGGVCHGCDNQDEPHVCERCKANETMEGPMDMDRLGDMNAILADAHRQALSFSHPYVGTEHLLLALIQSSGGKALMMKLGVDSADVDRMIRSRTQEGPTRVTSSDVCYTPRSKKVFEFAVKEADHFGCHQVRREHLLIGMIQEADGLAGTVLRELGVDAQRVRHAAAADLETSEARKAGAPAARLIVKTADGSNGAPCEHAEKFRQELRALYVRNHGVTLDGDLDFHCHICSDVFTIPKDVMRSMKPQPGAKQTTLEVTKFKCVSSINVPTGKGDRVLSELDVPGVLWTIRASDDVGEWHETYGSEIEKRAFLRGFEAASAMRGGPPPKVEEAET